jgi:hypothetical protein
MEQSPSCYSAYQIISNNSYLTFDPLMQHLSTGHDHIDKQQDPPDTNKHLEC